MITINSNNPIFSKLIAGDTYITNDGTHITLEYVGNFFVPEDYYYNKTIKMYCFKFSASSDDAHPLIGLYYDENLQLVKMLMAGSGSYFITPTEDEILSKQIIRKIPNLSEKIHLI